MTDWFRNVRFVFLSSFSPGTAGFLEKPTVTETMTEHVFSGRHAVGNSTTTEDENLISRKQKHNITGKL